MKKLFIGLATAAMILSLGATSVFAAGLGKVKDMWTRTKMVSVIMQTPLASTQIPMAMEFATMPVGKTVMLFLAMATEMVSVIIQGFKKAKETMWIPTMTESVILPVQTRTKTAIIVMETERISRIATKMAFATIMLWAFVPETARVAGQDVTEVAAASNRRAYAQ